MGLQGDLRDQFGIERAPVSGSGKKFTPKFPNGFTIGSTTINSTELAELQTLVDSDLATIAATLDNLSTTEIGYLDGVSTTAGRVTASKVVTCDANKDIADGTSTLRNVAITGTFGADGAITTGKNGVGGTAGGITVNNGANPGVSVSVDYTDMKKLDDITASATDLNKLDAITATGGVLFSERLTFTETAASGTYTATVTLPANSVILSIWPTGHVNWGAATSAALSLGYTGSLTAYINALDVKANDPATAGPYGLGDYFAGGTTITASCVTVDVAAGGAGRENFNIYYAIVTPVAATKA